MKFALVKDKLEEATKGAEGNCPACGSELIAMCGEVKIHHWSHKRNRNCDPWWEPETDWHRAWKNKFPKEWQEIVHSDDHGVKHIADVKTSSGWCIEFQHSPLNPEERRARNAFYDKLVWVVDGTRRPTDKKQFDKIIDKSILATGSKLIHHIAFPEECRLLREWHDNGIYVIFDFQDVDKNGQPQLWLLFPKTVCRDTYIVSIPRQEFIDYHNNNTFDGVKEKIDTFLATEISKKIQQATIAKVLAKRLPDPLAQHVANKQKRIRLL